MARRSLDPRAAERNKVRSPPPSFNVPALTISSSITPPMSGIIFDRMGFRWNFRYANFLSPLQQRP